MPTISGVYRITNAVNGKIYIGSSVNTWSRWSHHKGQLRRGAHHSPHLQSAWRLYGEAAFTFLVVEIAAPAALQEREQAWLDSTRCYDRAVGYNCAQVVAAPHLGRSLSPEHRASISRGLTGLRRSPRSPEHARKVGDANVGRVHSDAARANMGAARVGRLVSAETRDKLRRAQERVREERLEGYASKLVWLFSGVDHLSDGAAVAGEVALAV